MQFTIHLHEVKDAKRGKTEFLQTSVQERCGSQGDLKLGFLNLSSLFSFSFPIAQKPIRQSSREYRMTLCPLVHVEDEGLPRGAVGIILKVEFYRQLSLPVNADSPRTLCVIISRFLSRQNTETPNRCRWDPA